MPRFKARKADDMDEAAQVLRLAQQTANQAIADAQREADTWAARVSRSSSVSRPCSHAATRMRFTCSRATA